MVHRASDSRLLTNLLAAEKEYAKQLITLIGTNSTSLSSFSAYASASAPPLSHVIIAVAGSFAGADDALRRYAHSVDDWREQLKGLKDLEEDVGTIMRDREILVTRLIKASKAQKPTRDSLLLTQTPAAGSASSLRSDFSGSAGSGRLGAAQSELQACEAQLAAKERELDQARVGAVKRGLSARCRAMVECGWAWGEMGKEGLRALDGDEHPPLSTDNKPLPTPGPYERPSSDLSSISPSQSASQINLQLSPAHAISELELPTSVSAPATLVSPTAAAKDAFIGRHTLDRRISEEEEGGGSSEDEPSDAEGEGLQVVENVRFARSATKLNPDQVAPTSQPNGFSPTKRRFTIRRGDSAGSGSVAFPTSSSDMGPGRADGLHGTRERKNSGGGGFFGSLRGLFRHTEHKERDAEWENMQRRGVFSGGDKKWATRTDRNLKAAREGRGRDGESSDEEDVREGPSVIPGQGAYIASPPPSSPIAGPSKPQPPTRRNSAEANTIGREGSKRLKKSARAHQHQRRLSRQEESPAEAEDESPRASTQQSPAPVHAPAPTPDTPAPAQTTAHQVHTDDETEHPRPRRKKKRSDAAATGRSMSLGRNNSLMSTASAPSPRASRRVSADNPSTTHVVRASSLSHHDHAPQRATSLTTTQKPNVTANGHGGRQASVSAGGASLMSIVEDVARQNRQGWKAPGDKEVGVKAPPPATRSTLDGLPAVQITPPAPISGGAAGGSAAAVGVSIPRAPGSVLQDKKEGTVKIAEKGKAPARASTLPSTLAPSTTPVAASGKTSASHLSSGSGSGSASSGLSNNPTQTNALDALKPPTVSGHSRPAVSPLRSALRNSSRSPSPAQIGTASHPAAAASPSQAQAQVERPRGRSTSPPQKLQDAAPLAAPKPIPASICVPELQEVEDDAASISSYETGHEAWEDAEGDETEREDDPPPPPTRLNGNADPAKTPFIPGHKRDGSDASASSTSTVPAARAPSPPPPDPPARRKSVRVSLQPTFSPTPPAIDDTDSDEHAPWSGRDRDRDREEVDMWEDSSEEDVEYKRAKKLLSRVARRAGAAKDKWKRG